MSAITKAVPKAILTGIRDESRRALVPEPELLPQHLPLLFLLTEKGPEEPQMVVGDSFMRMYGSESLNPRSRYFNHQSKLASLIMGNANQVFVKRIKPTAAKTAMLRLSVEITRTTVDTYARITTPVGSDTIGEKTGSPTGTVEGYSIVWHRNIIPTGEGFGLGQVDQAYRIQDSTPSAANEVNGISTYEGVVSVLYPIADIEVSDFGLWGNRVALRVTAPTADDVSPGDVATMLATRAYLYRFTALQKESDTTSPLVVESVAGDISIDMALKADVVNPVTGLDMSANSIFMTTWRDTSTPGFPKNYGPFGAFHLYDSNLRTVLRLLCLGETAAEHATRTGVANPLALTAASPGEKVWDEDAEDFGRSADYAFGTLSDPSVLTSDPLNMYLLNILTGEDVNGVPYETLYFPTGVNGVSFTDNTNHYCVKGADGLTATTDPNARVKDLEIYDQAVATYLTAFGDSVTEPLLDEAKYPISAVWDSGFSHATKLKLLIPMGRRKDIYTILSSQAVADYVLPDDTNLPADPDSDLDWGYAPVNTAATENAYATALKTAALLYPESIIDGTATCRAVTVGHCGLLADNTWNRFLPLTLDFAYKVSRYMGASNGRWVREYSFDESPTNQVTLFRADTVNLTYKKDPQYVKDWDAGLVWVQNYDRQSLFYPGIQTVYPDDTSVLNSFMTMAACVELEHVVQRTWRDLTGGSRLTNEQFIERSNELILERTKDRFDGRFVIVPETYFTQADEARGYSWSCRVHIYANNMRTVGTFTIVAHRMSDLTAA